MAPRRGKKALKCSCTSSDLEFRRESQAKSDSKKKAAKQKLKQATVEDVDDFISDMEEDFASHGRLVQKVSKSDQIRTRELLGILQRTTAVLASIGGPEEVEALFQSSGIDDDETIGKIRKSCFNVISLLPVTKSVDSFSPNQVPSTIALYDQSFFYRASSSILYLLRPVDVFKGTKNYNRGKVFGYVRAKGSTSALMSALPGWFKCVENHERLLNSELWTEVVKPLADFHNHTFTTASYDVHHGREKGDTYATHVEPRLMLWFAIHELQKRTGKFGSPLEQRGDIWELRDLIREEVEAEIVLSRPPCRHCLKFQEWFQRYQPIKYSFIVCKNLGEVPLQKDKHGQISLPLYAEAVEDPSDSETELESDAEFPTDPQREPEHEPEATQRRPQVNKRSNLAVVIRQKSTPRTARRVSLAAAEVVESTPSEVVSTMMMAPNSGSRVSITTHLRQFCNTPPKTNQERRRRRDYFDSSDEEEWSPPARPRSKVQRGGMATPIATSNFIRTPNSAPFGLDAVHRARQFKEKRKTHHEVESSPTSAKKARIGKR